MLKVIVHQFEIKIVYMHVVIIKKIFTRGFQMPRFEYEHASLVELIIFHKMAWRRQARVRPYPESFGDFFMGKIVGKTIERPISISIGRKDSMFQSITECRKL